MTLVKKYKQLKNVPKHIVSAYWNKRYSVVIPDTKEFRTEAMYWSQVDWINYICMLGRMWHKDGRKIKI